MKKILISVLVSLVTMSAMAENFTIDDFTYATIDASTVQLTYGPKSGDIVIPSTVKYNGVTYTVTEIGNNAFFYSSIQSAVVPETVTYMGYQVFSGCKQLTSVTLPNSVTFLGHDMFAYCSNLVKVNLPNQLTSIERCTFISCSSLPSITIPKTVKSIEENAFIYCSSLTSIVIPDSVVSIGEHAFASCSSLTSIVIPESVVSVGEYAFCSKGLQSIYLKWKTSPTVPMTAINDINKNACVLYVPNGFFANFRNTMPWATFLNIEEWDPDYVMYYNLNVKYNDKVVAQLRADNGKSYKWRLPEGFNFVSFNGTNVTGQVTEGIYTTPAIKEDSEISVSFNNTNVKEDVNNDGQVNSLDVLKVYKYMQTH